MILGFDWSIVEADWLILLSCVMCLTFPPEDPSVMIGNVKIGLLSLLLCFTCGVTLKDFYISLTNDKVEFKSF